MPLTRISNPEKYNDAFYRKLPPLAKLLMSYFHDMCDFAGFIDVDMTKWSGDLNLGRNDIKDSLKALQPLLLRNDSGSKLWIKHFLLKQKQLPLNIDASDHLDIIEKLKRNQVSFGNPAAFTEILNTAFEFANKSGKKRKSASNSSTGRKGAPATSIVSDNPPTLDQWSTEFKRQHPEATTGEIESAYGMYQSKNWTYMTARGERPLVDWKGAVRTCVGKLKKQNDLFKTNAKQNRTQTTVQIGSKLS